MLDRAGERGFGLFGIVINITGREIRRFGGVAVGGTLDAAMNQAGRGTQAGWIECHVSGPLRTTARPLSSLESGTESAAGLFSALISPRRNPAGQITRTGNIPADR